MQFVVASPEQARGLVRQAEDAERAEQAKFDKVDAAAKVVEAQARNLEAKAEEARTLATALAESFDGTVMEGAELKASSPLWVEWQTAASTVEVYERHLAAAKADLASNHHPAREAAWKALNRVKSKAVEARVMFGPLLNQAE